MNGVDATANVDLGKATQSPVTLPAVFGNPLGTLVATARGAAPFAAQPNTAGSQTNLTGADGVALFEKIAPGPYTVSVVRDGYLASVSTGVTTTSATAMATVVAGVQPADATVWMVSGPSISGRVLDAFGAPMPNARLMLGTIGYREGRRTFLPQSTAQPDALGNYVLSPLSAGDYYVRVEPAALRGGGGYYPGVLEANDAMRLPVRTGQQIVGIDFRVPNSPTYRVSGTVLNLPARTGANGQPDTTVPSMSFVPADPRNVDPQNAPLMPNTRRGGTGEFEITLSPGLWDIFPVINLRTPSPVVSPPVPNAPVYATGRARVLVADRDVENVTVSIFASDVKGHLVMDGPAPANPQVRISLLPLENAPSPLLSHVRIAQPLDADGGFSFNAVPPGKYRLLIQPVPVGFYVADMRIGAKSIYDDGVITVEAEQLGPVEVSLRRGGGSVSARAPTLSTAAAPTTRVTLVPADPRQLNALLYKNAVGGRSLSSSFIDVAPGDYKVFAFESLPAGGAEQNADFMAPYQSFGVPVHVNAGETTTAEVRWIPAEP